MGCIMYERHLSSLLHETKSHFIPSGLLVLVQIDPRKVS